MVDAPRWYIFEHQPLTDAAAARHIRHIRLNDVEIACLKVLATEAKHNQNCLYFRTIVENTGFDLKRVRRAVRSLARKKLASYERGLLTEDGKAAGSGYCCTREGEEIARDLGLLREAEQRGTGGGWQPDPPA